MTLNEQYNNELYHYGVKGMKWGVRKYHNEDGSLNDRGKTRYEKLRKDLDRFEVAAQLDYASARGAVSKYKSAKTRADKNAYKLAGERAMSNASEYDRYANRTVRKIEKMGLTADRWETTAQMKEKAGRDYVKRSMAAKVGSVALSGTISAGAFYVQTRLMGLPFGMVYVTDGGSYKMRKDR